jgi:hypothetical protein
MGWKKRRNGRTYYYRSVRTSSGVRSEYVGAGATAELLADGDKELARQAKLKQAVWAQEVARFSAVDKDLAQWLRAVRHVVHMTLRCWGYRQHKRQWRLARRREEAMDTINTDQEVEVTHDRVMKLITAKALTPEQHDELEAGLKCHPSIVNNLGDLGAILRLQLISGMTKQPGIAVVWNARLRALRNEMGYAEATTSERLVIDTVVTCWLHLQSVERAYQSFCQQGGTPVQVATWEGRLSAAQNRFARQVELLAKLRYWGSRVNQINIAQNMIVSNG